MARAPRGTHVAGKIWKLPAVTAGAHEPGKPNHARGNTKRCHREQVIEPGKTSHTPRPALARVPGAGPRGSPARPRKYQTQALARPGRTSKRGPPNPAPQKMGRRIRTPDLLLPSRWLNRCAAEAAGSQFSLNFLRVDTPGDPPSPSPFFAAFSLQSGLKIVRNRAPNF